MTKLPNQALHRTRNRPRAPLSLRVGGLPCERAYRGQESLVFSALEQQ
jgi:hypothetical protein